MTPRVSTTRKPPPPSGSRYARLVLERCDNNKRQACRILDISYHTLQAYLRYTPKLKAAQKALPAAVPDEVASAGGEASQPAGPADDMAPEPVLEAALVPEP